MHIDHLHRRELLDDAARGEPRRQCMQPPRQSGVQAIGQEGDEDMRFDPGQALCDTDRDGPGPCDSLSPGSEKHRRIRKLVRRAVLTKSTVALRYGFCPGTGGSKPLCSARESVRTGLARLRGGPERYRRLLRPLNGGADSASAEPAAISTR